MGPYRYAFPSREALSMLPGGDAWSAVVEHHPDDERHLAMAERHFVGLNEADRAAWDAGAATLVDQLTLTGSPSQSLR